MFKSTHVHLLLLFENWFEKLHMKYGKNKLLLLAPINQYQFCNFLSVCCKTILCHFGICNVGKFTVI